LLLLLCLSCCLLIPPGLALLHLRCCALTNLQRRKTRMPHKSQDSTRAAPVRCQAASLAVYLQG
jgi:hypothetical protein